MTVTWTFEQAHDQGGNPIPNSYEIIETGRDGIPVHVAEVYNRDNARVIAAAKDMLAALKLARIFIERNRSVPGFTVLLEALNPTIAEAERD